MVVWPLVRDTRPSIVERDDEGFLVGQRRLVAIGSFLLLLFLLWQHQDEMGGSINVGP